MQTTPRARGLRLRLAVLAVAALALSLLSGLAATSPARADVSAGDLIYENQATPEIEQLSGGTVTDVGPGYDPDISPDGSQIAFVGTNGSSDPVEVMGSSGPTAVQPATHLDKPETDNEDDFVNDEHPRWSPNGQWIVFSREETYEDPDGDIQIYKVHPDGSDLTALTSSTGGVDNYFPSWSPDGSQIVYASNGVLYIMNADGSDAHVVDSSLSMNQQWPVWSPDGSRIYFTGYANTIYYLTSTDSFSGTDASLNTFLDGYVTGTAARVSSDGSTLYYDSDNQVYSVPTSGSDDPTQVTSGDGSNIDPSIATSAWPNTSVPSWWGDDRTRTSCDTTNSGSSALTDAGAIVSFDGVVACGPLPDLNDGAYVDTTFGGLVPDDQPQEEWMCVELVMRYMYLRWGVTPYYVPGYEVVSHYSGSIMTAVTNTGSNLPSVGDVISFNRGGGYDSTDGHTAIVTNVDVLDGTITVMQQNFASGGEPVPVGTIDFDDDGGLSTATVNGWLTPSS